MDDRSDDWDTRSIVSEVNGKRRQKSPLKKEKEKARSGLLGLFSRSKESLVEKDTRSGISSSGHRKHRSRSERAEDEGNVSDARSPISSSDRKHRSRGSEDAGRDTLDVKVDHTVPYCLPLNVHIYIANVSLSGGDRT
jgi:hypothetical protein